MEVRAGIEPTYADLQSATSPFCHRTSGVMWLSYVLFCLIGQAVVSCQSSNSMPDMACPMEWRAVAGQGRKQESTQHDSHRHA